MKLLVLSFLLVMAIPALAQTTLAEVIGSEDNAPRTIAEPMQEGITARVSHRLITPVMRSDSSDSLVAKRRFLTTTVYKNGVKLPYSSVIKLLQSTPKAVTSYRWGTILKPIGPLVVLSGLAIGYIGIKGDPATAIIEGKRTAANPRPPDEQVEYTKRSLPKLLAGLGLFVGGLYLIERSNELKATSVTLYNAKPGPIKTLSRLDHIKFGITSTFNVGVEASF